MAFVGVGAQYFRVSYVLWGSFARYFPVAAMGMGTVVIVRQTERLARLELQSPKWFRISTSLDRRSENVCVLPVVITELELGNIQRHIFAAHFVERSDYAAFEDRPEAFDGLSMDCSDDILAFGVVNNAMRIFAVKPIVAGPLIGTEQADFMRDGFANKCGESVGADIRDHAGNNIALAANGADDRSLARADAARSAAAPAFIPMPVFGQAANESFIDFDNAAELFDVLHESGSNLMAHEPSGPVRSEAHIAIDLQGAHAFLARKHEMDHAKPLPQRLVRILENRSGNMGEAIVSSRRRAFVAQPVPLHCTVFLDLHVAASRTDYAFWPAATGEIGATSVFVREGFFPLDDGHLVDWLGLLGGHIGSPSRQEPI
jgi:hypothetical protein